MQRSAFAFLSTCMILVVVSLARAEKPAAGADVVALATASTDWPWWRGPSRNGCADAKQKPPLNWSESENVLWKSPLPGRGHGSPTVVGKQVFLATAEHEGETQSVLC